MTLNRHGGSSGFRVKSIASENEFLIKKARVAKSLRGGAETTAAKAATAEANFRRRGKCFRKMVPAT